MGSRLGVRKIAAGRVGLTLSEYDARVAAGEKWCTYCKAWRDREDFGVDRSRGDGLAATCLLDKRVTKRRVPVPGAPTTEVGNAATNAVRTAVRQGSLPALAVSTCADCGRQAEQYHHCRGYEPEHWLDVVPLCTRCHRRRHWPEVQDGG